MWFEIFLWLILWSWCHLYCSNPFASKGIIGLELRYWGPFAYRFLTVVRIWKGHLLCSWCVPILEGLWVYLNNFWSCVIMPCSWPYDFSWPYDMLMNYIFIMWLKQFPSLIPVNDPLSGGVLEKGCLWQECPKLKVYFVISLLRSLKWNLCIHNSVPKLMWEWIRGFSFSVLWNASIEGVI